MWREAVVMCKHVNYDSKSQCCNVPLPIIAWQPPVPSEDPPSHLHLPNLHIHKTYTRASTDTRHIQGQHIRVRSLVRRVSQSKALEKPITESCP